MSLNQKGFIKGGPMFRKGFKKFDRKPKSGLDFEQVKYQGGSPAKEKVEADSMLYNVKAYRDLQNVGNIEVKADPNTEAAKGSYPYYIINHSNRVVDANYAGYDNIFGNILTRLQNSNNSKLLNIYDMLTINFRINYLYLCYKTNETTNHNNVAVNREMIKAFYEAISKAYSTMTTQLPYYTNIIAAPDAPEISDLSSSEAEIYGKMMGLLHYQSVLQNAVSPLSKYIETMSLEQTVLDMSYRREAPLITALYGLLRKKAFIATLNAVGTSILGEYFDDNWYKQINMLAFVPSRKSNAMVDPLMTATCTTLIPRVTFSVPVSGSDPVKYYDSNDLKVSGIFINPDTFQFEGTAEQPIDLTFEQLIYRLNRMLDVSTIIRWARTLNTDPSAVGNLSSPSAYYQQGIVKLIEKINILLTKFTTAMTDVRTFIDKLSESGMVYWKKGMSVKIDKIGIFNPVYNVALHNVISAYVGGSSEMEYDSSTQRWQCTTLWNKYTGIAEFDKKSGGAFITFGLRKLNLGGLSPTDTALCVPIAFADELQQGSSKCIITNRLGLTHELTSDSSANVLQNPVLARLDPLNVGFKVKVPMVDISSLSFSANEKYNCCSALLSLFQTIFGYGKVKYTSTSYHTCCEADYVCFLDIQLEDVSNEMIQFCRNYSPFRVSTPDGKRTMGFGNK